jgi:hypothetical protein
VSEQALTRWGIGCLVAALIVLGIVLAARPPRGGSGG